VPRCSPRRARRRARETGRRSKEHCELPPPGTAFYELETTGGTYVVAALPPPLALLLARCTPAERDVFPDLLAGRSNAEIATRRRRSVRTVANQVASLLWRLGARSRRELAALAAGHGREAKGYGGPGSAG
jgi:DNA-binding NarL/FixJ family response regulator